MKKTMGWRRRSPRVRGGGRIVSGAVGAMALLIAVWLLSAGAGAAPAVHAYRNVTAVRIPGGRGHRPIAGWAFIGRGYVLSRATVSLWTL